ncbi:MAG: hypothetical protein ABW061_25225 [Polyangiaceae bacterium]
MFWRSVRVACVLGLVSLVAASACGGSSSNPDSGSGGAGGRASAGSAGKTATAGTAGTPPALKCGTATCNPVVLPIGDFAIPPCCADADRSQCGLDSSVLAQFGPTFPDACQPLDQPGEPDTACPESEKTPVTGTTQVIGFHGCCRANGTCGYDLNKLGDLFPLGLGCVDSAPFLDGGTPIACGGVNDGAGGQGGASQGGEAGVVDGGRAGAAGAPSEGGAAGQ